MPIYEYRCKKCEHKFEKLVKLGVLPPFCPKCEGETEKLVSRGNFALKGGGWFKDGYSKK
jgi:putative FmdB family regulatory protein